MISLTDFIENILAGARQRTEAIEQSGTERRDADTRTRCEQRNQGGPAMVSQKPMINRGFFATLADYLKITFEGIGSLGDSVVDSGQVWVVDLYASGKPSEPKQIGLFNAWRGPFSVRTVLLCTLFGEGESYESKMMADHQKSAMLNCAGLSCWASRKTAACSVS